MSPADESIVLTLDSFKNQNLENHDRLKLECSIH